jgi:hypothetical protein
MSLPSNIDTNYLTVHPIFAFDIFNFELPFFPIKYELFYFVLQSFIFLN